MPSKAGKVKHRITRSSVMSNHWGGCIQCHNGGGVGWDCRNVQSIAKQHAQAYGHETWADITFSHRYTPE